MAKATNSPAKLRHLLDAVAAHRGPLLPLVPVTAPKRMEASRPSRTASARAKRSDILREYAHALRRMAADHESMPVAKLVELAGEWESEADRIEQRPDSPPTPLD